MNSTNYNRHTHQRIHRTKNENNKIIVEEIEEIDEEFNYNENKPFEIQEQVEDVDGEEVTLVDDDDDDENEPDQDTRLKSNLNRMNRPAASIHVAGPRLVATKPITTTDNNKIRIKNTRKKIK